ncbi:hypothetical protein T484DRAFT_1609127, partial [Baffinella frigidus]
VHPTPYVHPPYTLLTPYLHPVYTLLTPYALHPTPYTLHPTSCTLHPTPYTLHPKIGTTNPEPRPRTRCFGRRRTTQNTSTLTSLRSLPCYSHSAPLRMAYRRVLRIFTYGLFTKSLRSSLSGYPKTHPRIWACIATPFFCIARLIAE